MYAQSNVQTLSVCSAHPLVAQMLQEAVATAVALDFKIRVLTVIHDLQPRAGGELLVLDGCCDDDWPKCALRWQKKGGKVLVLLSASAGSTEKQRRVLFLGVKGVIVTSGHWQSEIRNAITTVLQGRLWVSGEVLNQYVLRISPLAKHCLGSAHQAVQLTAREEQIMTLLLTGYSNKEIASALEITERTAKYHVSNILQKCQASSRKQLLENMAKDEETTANTPHPVSVQCEAVPTCLRG